MYSHTLIVNFFAGAGAGKSTLAPHTFAELKYRGVNAEFVPEFAKSALWEGRDKVFKDQSYIFGKQHFKVVQLLDEVEVIVTDSPILLSALYNESLGNTFNQFVVEEFKRFNSLNIFINRVNQYSQIGRFETEEEARKDDLKLLGILDKNSIPYLSIDGCRESVPYIVDLIMKKVS